MIQTLFHFSAGRVGHTLLKNNDKVFVFFWFWLLAFPENK